MQMLGVALDRALGTDPARLARACEASVFSEPTRERLKIKHLPALRAHEQCPGVRAAHLFDVVKAMGADQPVGTMRAREAATVMSNWSNLLAETLNRRLLTAYAEASFGEQSLFQPGRANDYRAHAVVNLVEAADLSTVAEDDPYADVTVQSDSTVSITPTKKGALAGFSYEVFKNDDVLGIARSVDNLGRAARRTLAKAVWALWTGAGATYGGDSKAWFHTDHSNYGTTALTADASGTAAVVAAVRQLLDQTRPGGAEKLALRAAPGSLWLTVPNALWDIGYWINQQASSPLFHLFGPANEYVLVNPLLTDATDWGVHLDSRQIESVRVDFLDGREEPELLTADQPRESDVFGNDRIRLKLRHVWGAGLAEYRGAVKRVVA
jgi:hypothetical protein